MVGTGGGTVIDKCGGFSSNSVRLGFSEQTTLGTLATGAFSSMPLACLFIPAFIAPSLLSSCMIPDDLLVDEVDESDEAIVLCGWKLELSNCLRSWFLASSLFSEVGDPEDVVDGGDLVLVEETEEKLAELLGGVDKRLDKVDILGVPEAAEAVDIMTTGCCELKRYEVVEMVRLLS